MEWEWGQNKNDNITAGAKSLQKVYKLTEGYNVTKFQSGNDKNIAVKMIALQSGTMEGSH